MIHYLLKHHKFVLQFTFFYLLHIIMNILTVRIKEISGVMCFPLSVTIWWVQKL